MADALLGVVTEAVLTNAISLANEWLSGVLGVKEDLQSLAETLELIQALLSDAESKSTTNKIIEVWLKRLTDAATDADDLLDEFAYQVLSKKMLKGKRDKVCSCFSSSNPLLFRSKMASKIKKINLQMKEIFENANQIGLRPVEIINSSTDPRKVQLTVPFVDDSKIVGRGDEVSEIVTQLTCSGDGKNFFVIGIVGMGGQGKTTLAQLLMKNDKVKKYFEKTVWTCVSDDFDVDRVLEHMLQSLTEEASHLINREAIVKKLSKELQGKRFLLVLDDVWNEDSQLWGHMNDSLQAIGGSEGSKIIVTTRNEVVVTKMNGFVHRLGVLSGKDSQELFEKMAFGNDRAAKYPRLVEIGERIVPRCGGVPLALKAIGGLLSSQREELEWLKIEESSIWIALGGVQSAIKLSFDHLPYLSLKKCFAYCSVFPKDSIIVKDHTIQQWMAHGLLNPSSGSDLEMEDIGNNYFKILLQRSLLQEAEFDRYGNIRSCKMHDLVHDFALETSKGHCLTAEVGQLIDDIKAVHLSIVCVGRNNLNISSERNFPRLRTLHLPNGFSENFLVHCKCERLRVLTLADGEMRELPISIAEMKHLRYLDIFGTCIRALPEFISKLYNLQTLRLPDAVNLPKDFAKLVTLRHLVIKEIPYTDIDLRYPLTPGIGEMTSLRTLNYFRVSREEGCQIKELCNLKHLEGRLKIVGLENVANEDDARRANLSGKRNIESLELVWLRSNIEGSSDDESVLKVLQPRECLKALNIENFMGKSLPSWILLLHNLMSLKLRNLENCEQIPPLGHLPFLKVLNIDGMKSVKCIGKDFYGRVNLNLESADSVVVFPSLKELRFGGMSSLEEWSDVVQPSFVSSSSTVELFPCLEKFEIERCSCLTRLPEDLLSISTGLESLSIEFCAELVSIPDLSSLHSLKMLSISFCGKLVSIPDLSRLHSLKDLNISYCRKLSALPRGIEACRSLETLRINCRASVMENLLQYLTNLKSLTLDLSDNVPTGGPVSNSSADDIQGHDDPFPTLEDLELNGIMSQLKSLPEFVQGFTALTTLRLVKFSRLETLPEWVGNFHSLRKFALLDCVSLANFPSVEVMRGLTNLKSLQIMDCPILNQRCEREIGAEWHKIAHIPEIDIL